MKQVDLSKCKFAADIVPYMYAELPASESSVFESHLLECRDCTDEFALISNARFEVYEWKKLEFDPLETPHFEIPYDEAAQTVSWFDKVRAAFASSWAIPAVGFASLAIISVFAASILLSGGGATDLANVSKSGGDTSVSVPPPSSPTTLMASPVNEGVVVATDVEKNARKEDTPRRATTAGHTVIRHTSSDSKPARLIEARSTTAVKPAPKVPTLNEYSDDEDNSLRLAELFEDVETE